jgi:hypothetical protein
MNEHLERRKAQRRKDFVWVERMSTLLDNKYSIGGFRFGLDPLLNLIPYGGQIIAFAVSLMLVVVMYRNGVGTKVVVKMLLNVLYDAVLGAIPFFGQVFDFFNKANSKNVKLLREYYFEEKHQGSARGLLLVVVGVLILLCALTFYLMWILAAWSWELLSGLF